MKKFVIAAALLAATTAAANADMFAPGNTYASILAGANFNPNESLGANKFGMDTGYNVGGRYGVYLGDWGLSNVSLEADAFHNGSGFSGTNQHLGSTSLMANLIYHLNTGGPFSLYGGAGLGGVNTEYGGAPVRTTDQTVFGWQAIGGVETPINPDMSMFAEYRYQNAHWANVGGIPHVGNTSDNVSVGLKFNL